MNWPKPRRAVKDHSDYAAVEDFRKLFTEEAGNLYLLALLLTGDEVKAETLAGLRAIDIREHEKNWFDCIRSGKSPNADIELAIRAQVVLSLAEISNLRKTTCLFDSTTRKITDGKGTEITPPSYDG